MPFRDTESFINEPTIDNLFLKENFLVKYT